jgi:ABC-type uncharacterized transport system substrate-binding protein
MSVAGRSGNPGVVWVISPPPPTLTFSRHYSARFATLGVEGHNLAIEYRVMLGQSKTYDELAAELARLAPDAIVVVGTPSALAAKRQTTTIPIILAPAADPLRSGLVVSIARRSLVRPL